MRGNHQYLCYTDQDISSKVWEIIKVDTVSDPARASRIFKASPGFDQDNLWIDANFTLRVDPNEILNAHPESVVNFKHRDRIRIKDEAKEIIRLRKDTAQSTNAQLAAYQADGFDTEACPMTALSCNGMILRRPGKQVERFNALLAQQLKLYTSRDQMALDYCAWVTDIELGKFPGTFDSNPYTRYTHY